MSSGTMEIKVKGQRWLLGVLSLILLLGGDAKALDYNGNGDDRNRAILLYTFEEGQGSVVRDRSIIGDPLDLTIDHPGRTAWGSELLLDPESGIDITSRFLSLNEATQLVSRGVNGEAIGARKVTQACNRSDEFTLELWIRTSIEDQRDIARIFSLAHRNNPASDRYLQFYHEYDAFSVLNANVRRQGEGQNGVNGFQGSEGVPAANQMYHIYLVKGQRSLALYVNGIPVAVAAIAPNLNWGNNNDYSIVLGNATSSPLDDLANFDLDTNNDNEWIGELHMVAFYCQGKTREELLGDLESLENADPVMPQPTAAITPAMEYASTIFSRIAGVRIPIDDPRLKEMEQLILQGDKIGAADVATRDHNFYNVTVKHLASRMSSRDSAYTEVLNDMMATFIGVVRDELDARLLLSGNFSYVADLTQAAVPSNPLNDMITSNNHYASLEEQGYNLGVALIRRDGQLLRDSNDQVVANPDPAGVLTSRAFMQSHAIMGTNRRMVEYTIKQFACAPIEAWADNTSADQFVGRDVDRFPGGKFAEYQTTCKSCHANMDALRGAFAKVDFEDGFIKHSDVMSRRTANIDNTNPDIIKAGNNGIVVKMNRNSEIYPQGYEIVNASWVNQATRGVNYKFFGWRGNMQGTGMGAFGQMVSNSKAFSRCMVQRVYRQVCKREVTPSESQLVGLLGDAFETQGYNLKWLFKAVATNEACIGAM